jgi:hypothetical protein
MALVMMWRPTIATAPCGIGRTALEEGGCGGGAVLVEAAAFDVVAVVGAVVDALLGEPPPHPTSIAMLARPMQAVVIA